MDDHSDEQGMAENEVVIRKALLWSIPLLMMTFILPILSFNGFMVPAGESNALWFQRSGSLMVICAVWVEFKLFRISGDIFLSGLWTSHEEVIAERYKTPFQAVKYIALAGAVLGTVIWGYGDILWNFTT